MLIYWKNRLNYSLLIGIGVVSQVFFTRCLMPLPLGLLRPSHCSLGPQDWRPTDLSNPGSWRWMQLLLSHLQIKASGILCMSPRHTQRTANNTATYRLPLPPTNSQASQILIFLLPSPYQLPSQGYSSPKLCLEFLNGLSVRDCELFITVIVSIFHCPWSSLKLHRTYFSNRPKTPGGSYWFNTVISGKQDNRAK